MTSLDSFIWYPSQIFLFIGGVLPHSDLHGEAWVGEARQVVYGCAP